MPTNDRLAYTIDELNTVAGIGRTLAYALIASGELPSLTIGKRKRLVTRRALEDFLARREAAEQRNAAG